MSLRRYVSRFRDWRPVARYLRLADRSLTVRAGGALVVFVGLTTWVYYLAERGPGGAHYTTYGQALEDTVILVFSGFDVGKRPTTFFGYIAAISVLVAGVVFVTLLFGDTTSYLVRRALGRERGLKGVKVNDHVLVCNWNDHSRGLVDQILSDDASRTKDVIIVADLPNHPYPESGARFVSGSPTRDEVLTRAAIDTATTAIITGQDGDAVTNDSVAILTALAIEARNPAVYTCVLVFDPASRPHLKHAHVDEVVCVGEMTTGLLVQAALNHGLTSLLSQLLSFGEGCEIYKVELPREAVGLGWAEIASLMLESHGASLMAVERRVNGSRQVVTRPSSVQQTGPKDCAFIFAESLPRGLEVAG